MQKNNTSGFAGITWNKERQKWRATIQVNKRRILLGEYDDPEEANKAYKLAKKVRDFALGFEKRTTVVASRPRS